MKYIKLYNGLQMPLIGSGTNTFGKVNHEYQGEINGETIEFQNAMNSGYRLFDTALSYRNESVLAKAIDKSDFKREDFFIVSKIPGRHPEFRENEKAMRKSIRQSLTNLNTDYIDLFLIHHPWDNQSEMLILWEILEEHYQKGIFKSIGVSNFAIEDMDHLLTKSTIKPMVNQIESHPGKWNDSLIDYLHGNDIHVMAWGPLTNVSNEAKKVLSEIGEKYQKNWGQIALKYQIDRKVIVIPKSHHAERQLQNLALFDFELTASDKEKISKI